MKCNECTCGLFVRAFSKAREQGVVPKLKEAVRLATQQNDSGETGTLDDKPTEHESSSPKSGSSVEPEKNS